MHSFLFIGVRLRTVTKLPILRVRLRREPDGIDTLRFEEL